MQFPLVSTFTRAFMVMLVAVLLPRRMREGRCTPGGYPSWPGIRDFSQYCYVGRCRTRYGGGGSELSLCPERPRSSGRYAGTRNPMHLGHLIFLADLGLFARSSPITFVAMAHIP